MCGCVLWGAAMLQHIELVLCLLSVFVLTDIVQITTSDVVLDCHATGWKDKVGHVGGRKRPY